MSRIIPVAASMRGSQQVQWRTAVLRLDSPRRDCGDYDAPKDPQSFSHFTWTGPLRRLVTRTPDLVFIGTGQVHSTEPRCRDHESTVRVLLYEPVVGRIFGCFGDYKLNLTGFAVVEDVITDSDSSPVEYLNSVT